MLNTPFGTSETIFPAGNTGKELHWLLTSGLSRRKYSIRLGHYMTMRGRPTKKSH